MAGKPLISFESDFEEIAVPETLGCKECYALRVVGDSLTGELIGDGDIIVVKPQIAAENGKLVVCAVKGEYCVKRFFQKHDKVELHSSNSKYPPMVVSPSEIEIIGVVTGQYRQVK